MGSHLSNNLIGNYSSPFGRESARHLRLRPAMRDLQLSAWDKEFKNGYALGRCPVHIHFLGYFMQGGCE